MNKIKIIGRNENLGTYFLCEEGHDLQERYDIERGVEAAMRFSLISYQLKHLLGETLTTIEAVIADDRQLKAVKSLIKSQFHAKIDWIYEQCGCPEDEQEYLLGTVSE